MLEDPTYSSIVRWGDERDSFVVLEVRSRGSWRQRVWITHLMCPAERALYQVHPAQTFQA